MMTTERPTVYRIIHLWPNKLPVDQRDSCTVQIKAEDGNGSLPSQFVSLQDYERLERESNLRLAHAGHRAELAEGKAERAEEALREIAEDNEHPSWRKAKAIAREALKSESQERAS